MNNHKLFSKTTLGSGGKPIFLNIKTGFDAPCSGWIDAPNKEEDKKQL
jgi:hypothetical protein